MCGLKELYFSFNQKFLDVKIGFSKFCSLRPKWCVLVGSSGTHSACVCTMYQNLVLKLNGVNLDKSCHELIDQVVCNSKNKNCMLHHWDACPGIMAAQQFLARTIVAKCSMITVTKVMMMKTVVMERTGLTMRLYSSSGQQ